MSIIATSLLIYCVFSYGMIAGMAIQAYRETSYRYMKPSAKFWAVIIAPLLPPLIAAMWAAICVWDFKEEIRVRRNAREERWE